MRWWSPREPVDPMYMPGRLRTGSRPSRTVMSLAPYVVLALKKSLLVGDFYLHRSLSDRTVVSPGFRGGEAGRGGPCNRLSQARIGDLGRDLSPGRESGR